MRDAAQPGKHADDDAASGAGTLPETVLLVRRIAGTKRRMVAGWTGRQIPEAYQPIGGPVRLPLISRLADLDAAWSTALLKPSPKARLAERVEELTETRAGVIAAHDAELRRIEQDLHDGHAGAAGVTVSADRAGETGVRA
ncbi:MAG: hypothetical protein QOF84_375 [Streptomyces sp.]|nr:hypothetical protein [Streptomyces sp.]